MLRSRLAPNPSPLTLEGTRTWLVGRDRVLVIDPGSDDDAHLDAIAAEVGDGALDAILLTHGHPDHTGGADRLADRFGATVRAHRRGNLRDGDRFPSDAGDLVAVATPGHTPDHFAFHWPDQDAVFCGDLMMGGHDTALVAPPEGRLGPYLASLDRIAGLGPRVVHPAHGPSFHQPADALDRYVRHRHVRLDQVRAALQAGAADEDDLLPAVYGEALDPALRDAARAALRAYLHHLQAAGEIRRRGRNWEATSP